MTIKTIYIAAAGGFDSVSVETSQPVDPGPGEITVRLRASSLNFHDYMVVKGLTGPRERRIPMSDGAGHGVHPCRARGRALALIGNGDAHLKNFCFLTKSNAAGMELAHYYDPL